VESIVGSPGGSLGESLVGSLDEDSTMKPLKLRGRLWVRTSDRLGNLFGYSLRDRLGNRFGYLLRCRLYDRLWRMEK
jgi:hypothetical protein